MHVWVGSRSHTDDNYWVWESGVPVDEPTRTILWMPREPDLGGSTFACISLRSNLAAYMMADDLCTSNHASFLCELPL